MIYDETCETCGEAVNTSEWHPIAADVGDDGEVRLFAFCSRVCQAAWERD